MDAFPQAYLDADDVTVADGWAGGVGNVDLSVLPLTKAVVRQLRSVASMKLQTTGSVVLVFAESCSGMVCDEDEALHWVEVAQLHQVAGQSSSGRAMVAREAILNFVDAFQAVNHHLPVKANVVMDAAIGIAVAVTTVVNYYCYPDCPGLVSNEMMHLLGFPKGGISYRQILVYHKANL